MKKTKSKNYYYDLILEVFFVLFIKFSYSLYMCIYLLCIYSLLVYRNYHIDTFGNIRNLRNIVISINHIAIY